MTLMTVWAISMAALAGAGLTAFGLLRWAGALPPMEEPEPWMQHPRRRGKAGVQR